MAFSALEGLAVRGSGTPDGTANDSGSPKQPSVSKSIVRADKTLWVCGSRIRTSAFLSLSGCPRAGTHPRTDTLETTICNILLIIESGNLEKYRLTFKPAESCGEE